MTSAIQIKISIWENGQRLINKWPEKQLLSLLVPVFNKILELLNRAVT